MHALETVMYLRARAAGTQRRLASDLTETTMMRALLATLAMLAPYTRSETVAAMSSDEDVLGAGRGRSLITIEGAMAQDTSTLDPDDFLWEKLPGRCCFYGGPDPEDPSKWLGAHTCDQCSVWDLPNNFCHTSRSACEECGMQLYCDPTPPLVDGNKVCTGPSRVGHGCEDALGTGVCASHSLGECQDLCRQHSECEMLVYYPQERQGTCILCADLSVRARAGLQGGGTGRGLSHEIHRYTRTLICTHARPWSWPAARGMGMGGWVRCHTGCTCTCLESTSGPL